MVEFCTARPVSGQRFFDRDDVLDVLLRDAEAMAGGGSPRWFALLGVRKAGKTSLLLELFRRLPPEVLGISVDCWQVRTTAAELFRLLAVASLDAFIIDQGLSGKVPLPSSARTPEDLAELQGLTRGRVPAPVEEGLRMLRALAQGDDSMALCEGVADLPQRLAEHSGRSAMVSLDEFQELASLPKPRRGKGLTGDEIYALLRSKWQAHDKVMYVVAGSRMTALRSLFVDREAPFFQHFTPLDVGPFSRVHAAQLLATHLAASGVDAEPEVIEVVIKAVGTLPYYLQVIGAALVDYLDGEAPGPSDVRRALDRCLFRADGVLNLVFRNHFERVVGRSGMLARTLQALAVPHTLGELSDQLRTSSGAAGTYVRRLQDEDVVAKDAEGRYVIADPCFGLWIQGQEDLGGVPPPTLIGDESERRVTEELAALGFRVIYQSRASRGTFDLIALHRGHEVAVQVKTGDPPLRLPTTELKRMKDEAKQHGWIPLLATVGRAVRFFEIAGVNAGRRRSVPFDLPMEDILAVLRQPGL